MGADRMMSGRWPITLLVAAYLVLAVMYSIVTPLFESPDEVWHYEYTRWLAAGKGLAAPEDVGVAPWAQEGSQPPLYYLLGAAVTWFIPTDNAAEAIRYNVHAAVGNADAFGNKNMMLHGRVHAWPWRGVTLAAHITRFVSVLLGALTVLLTYRIALTALPGWPAAAVLATALLAFSPQFLFISASTNNDNLVIVLATAGLYLSMYLVADKKTPQWWIWLVFGAVVGLAALSKLSGLLLAALAAVTILAVAWGSAWRVFGQAMLLTGGRACRRGMVVYPQLAALWRSSAAIRHVCRCAATGRAGRHRRIACPGAGRLALHVGGFRLVQRAGRAVGLLALYAACGACGGGMVAGRGRAAPAIARSHTNQAGAFIGDLARSGKHCGRAVGAGQLCAGTAALSGPGRARHADGGRAAGVLAAAMAGCHCLDERRRAGRAGRGRAICLDPAGVSAADAGSRRRNARHGRCSL
ncbi:MAG: glycosyltransferase family 39 protein [Anaerolineales bacterium]|nr:glycosyltransferase family 39 protein [Anaerolineales bacterium]